jgi:hypothetical protein
MFHLHSRHRKRKNFIAKLVAAGYTLTNHYDKANAMFEYYENLLGTSLDRAHSINLQELGINSHNLADLDMPFSEEEVWATVKRIPSNKAPRPDGFTGRFYKTCWPIIKGDIIAAILAIWSRKFMGFAALNTAYITLLPKKVDAEQPKDFRPISLVHA